jgi:hypothetical protein
MTSRKYTRPKPPLRECVDGCGTKRYRWKDFVCRSCVAKRIADPAPELVARREDRYRDRSPRDLLEYDAAQDPFASLRDQIGASVGLIGGATLTLDVEGPGPPNKPCSAPQQLSLDDWTLE